MTRDEIISTLARGRSVTTRDSRGPSLVLGQLPNGRYHVHYHYKDNFVSVHNRGFIIDGTGCMTDRKRALTQRGKEVIQCLGTDLESAIDLYLSALPRFLDYAMARPGKLGRVHDW